VTDTLPPAGYAADTPRPAVGFSIDVPAHWTVLDLNPETWDGWLDAFLDRRLAGRPNPATERGPAWRALLDLLRQLHQAKVFMAAILAAEVDTGLVSASATLAWSKLDTHGEGIPVAGLREVYVRAAPSPGEDMAARRVEVVQLPSGGAVKVTTRQTMRLPGLERPCPVALTQYFVPVLATDWLAVITTSTGNQPLITGVEEVAAGMATTLRFHPPEVVRQADESM
jgi:hypothetical protein